MEADEKHEDSNTQERGSQWLANTSKPFRVRVAILSIVLAESEDLCNGYANASE